MIKSTPLVSPTQSCSSRGHTVEDLTPNFGNQLASSIRWTVWLSAVSVPCSFIINVLLARTSPEAIGGYGVLSVYISFVSSFLYVGGDAVIIRFIPNLPRRERLSFLATYSVLLLVLALPWILIGYRWPQALTFIFGHESKAPFFSEVLALSPIYLFACIASGALRAILDMRSAIALARSVTFGSFLVVAFAFAFAPATLARQYIHLIWYSFFVSSGIAALIGVRQVYRQYRAGSFRVRPLLPKGFWRYTGATQQLSMIGFWSSRLDSVLILNFASLSVLGQYVSILAVTSAISAINGFFRESLLPGLAHALAASDDTAVAQVFNFHKRVVCLVNACTSLGLMCCASLAIAVLGPKYLGLRNMIVVATFFTGLSSPLTLGGTLLSSTGKQQRAVWVGLAQSGLFAVLFILFWHRWALWTAVIAYGTSLLLGNTVLMILGQHSLPVHTSIQREQGALALTSVLCVCVTWHLRGWGAAGCWVVALGCFLLLAGYTPQEFRRLVSCFLPQPGKRHPPTAIA